MLGSAKSPDARGSGFLQQPCHIPSQIAAAKGQDNVKLIGNRVGTIEFWMKPKWQNRQPAFDRVRPWGPARSLFHFGMLRKKHPYLTNCAAVVLTHDGQRDRMCFQISAHVYAGWSVTSSFSETNQWRHVACVWDLNAEPQDRERVYFDGKRINKTVYVWSANRLKGTRGQVDTRPYPIQLGSLVTGRNTANALIDDFRISRPARYTDDFTPPAAIALDRKTTALFSFDGSLDGAGMTAAGQAYQVTGVPGVAEYR